MRARSFPAFRGPMCSLRTSFLRSSPGVLFLFSGPPSHHEACFRLLPFSPPITSWKRVSSNGRGETPLRRSQGIALMYKGFCLNQTASSSNLKTDCHVLVQWWIILVTSLQKAHAQPVESALKGRSSYRQLRLAWGTERHDTGQRRMSQFG